MLSCIPNCGSAPSSGSSFSQKQAVSTEAVIGEEGADGKENEEKSTYAFLRNRKSVKVFFPFQTMKRSVVATIQ